MDRVRAGPGADLRSDPTRSFFGYPVEKTNKEWVMASFCWQISQGRVCVDPLKLQLS